MVPTHWRCVHEQFIGHVFTCVAEVRHGVGYICRVPIHDGGDDEIEARGAELLRFMGAVRNPTLLEGANRAGQLVPLLAFVEPRLTAAAQSGAFQPIQHEQCPLDPAHFLQGKIELILAFVGGQFAQHG